MAVGRRQPCRRNRVGVFRKKPGSSSRPPWPGYLLHRRLRWPRDAYSYRAVVSPSTVRLTALADAVRLSAGMRDQALHGDAFPLLRPWAVWRGSAERPPLRYRPYVIAHELGHNCGLHHAPCGGPELPRPAESPLGGTRSGIWRAGTGSFGRGLAAGSMVPPQHSRSGVVLRLSQMDQKVPLHEGPSGSASGTGPGHSISSRHPSVI